MQPKFTQKNLGYFCTRIIALALIFSASTQFSFAQQNPAKANKLSAVQKAQERSKALQALKANPTANNDAGILSKASTEINSPAATCTTWTFSVVAGDPPLTTRPFRDGVVKTCAAPGGPCQAGIAGAFHYQLFQWTNPVAQCVTVTYNATNANFSFVTVYSASPNLANLCTNWVTDAGSSATAGTPIVFSFNGAAGTTYYFLVDDVGTLPANGTVQIDAGVCNGAPCAGTPNPGATTGPSSVCPSIPFTVGITTPQNFAGITYQWQSSLTGVPASFADIAGATSSTYTTSITVPTWYQCKVRCTNSGITTISSPAKAVAITPTSGCYCAGGATDVIDEKISRVRYNTIDNSSSSQSGYEDFTAISTTVIQGSTQDITVDISNFFAGDLVRVWIDFNQNGNWNDPGERVVALVTSVNPGVASITIPLASSIGPTRMRVRMYWQPTDPDPGPCGNTAYGQVEDYTVNIQPCIQGVFNTQPVNRSINCGDNTTFSVVAAGSLLTYGWEYKTSAASVTWFDVTNGGIYSGATTPTLTLTNVPQTYNGYVYRATIKGPCTAIDFSNPATLTVGPYVVTFSPPPTNPVTICTGTLQQISISNLVSGTANQNFTSGAISIPIPDGNNSGSGVGINHTIPVVLPAGAQITSVNCIVNIGGHTWDGDICFVLKAPNTKILNLDYFLSGTGAGPSSPVGFVNTKFSPPPVSATLGGGVPPYTGTFKPDAELTGAFGNAGPNGFIPNTQLFSDLYGGVNGGTGNWVLAIYDGFGGDVGTLTNWQLEITYTIPAFAAGVWTASPPAPPNTMWATAAGSGGAAYVAGTQATSIWVNPTVNTNYTATVTTATPCTASGTVTVNVTNPVTIALAGQPVNKSACVGSNASFSVTAGGGPLTYQWQVSVDGGITYSNIAGATAATLNLIGVTQLMNNNLYRVVVTASPCGSVTSAVARLNTFQLPVVTISSTFLQLVPGRVATITGTSSPAPFSATSWSWTLNGGLIAGATGNSVTANIDQQGAYRATVTDINGCVNSSNIVTISSEASSHLWIYPNPTTGKFEVRLYFNGAIAERRIVKIFNMGGQLVAQKEFDLVSGTHPYLSLQFDLGKQSAGTYVVKVVDKNVGDIASGLVVIQ